MQELREFFRGLMPWDRAILEDGLPVYIYGMGNGSEKVLKRCRELGIEPAGVFASDDHVRGQSFMGYQVLSLRDAEEQAGKMNILLGFGTSLPEVMERIDRLEQRHCLFAPDVPVIEGKETAFDKEVFLERLDRAERVYRLLADEESRRVFRNVTAFKITGLLSYLREVFSDEEETDRLLELGDREIYCDLGAYNGDTVLKFVQLVNESYRHIYGMEPEKRNFQKCLRACKGLDSIELNNAAAWSHDTELGFAGGSGRQARVQGGGGGLMAARSLDSVLRGRECTYIKYDVEGADIPALEGSAETIRRWKPKLRCGVYHRCYDYMDIPLYIHELEPGYRLYLRQSTYYPAWETEVIAK